MRRGRGRWKRRLGGRRNKRRRGESKRTWSRSRKRGIRRSRNTQDSSENKNIN